MNIQLNSEYKYINYFDNKVQSLFNSRDIVSLKVESEHNCCGTKQSKELDFTYPITECVYKGKYWNSPNQSTCSVAGTGRFPESDFCQNSNINSDYYSILSSLYITIAENTINIIDRDYDLLDSDDLQLLIERIQSYIPDYNITVDINLECISNGLCVEILFNNLPSGVIPERFILSGRFGCCYITTDFECIDNKKCIKYKTIFPIDSSPRTIEFEYNGEYYLCEIQDVTNINNYINIITLQSQLENCPYIDIEKLLIYELDGVVIIEWDNPTYVPFNLYYKIENDNYVCRRECIEWVEPAIECTYSVLIDLCNKKYNTVLDYLVSVNVVEENTEIPFTVTNGTYGSLSNNEINIPGLNIEQISDEEYLFTYVPVSNEIPYNIEFFNTYTGLKECFPFTCTGLNYFICDESKKTDSNNVITDGKPVTQGCCTSCNKTPENTINNCYEPNKLEFIQNGFRLYPEFFNQSGEYLKDGIYNISITVKTKTEIITFTSCVFVDKLIKCNITSITDIDTALKALNLYDLTSNAVNCDSCSCENACLYYANLLKTVKNADKGNNPLMQCAN